MGKNLSGVGLSDGLVHTAIRTGCHLRLQTVLTKANYREQQDSAEVQIMMKSNQSVPEKDPARQLQTFEQQPRKNKEIELTKDQAEKSTGQERVANDRKIRAKAGPGNGQSA